MKFGEVLVRQSLITPEQLQEALSAQLIYGGHIGTCLIEKGFIKERLVGEVLAETLGVNYATQEMLQDIPRFVTAAVQAKVVEKYSIVPFRLEDKTLHVAMVNPRDLLALDELTFAAGFRIEAWVAPEARVYQAMEQYHGVPRRLRFINLCQRLDDDTPEPVELSGSPEATIDPTPIPIPVAELAVDASASRVDPENDPLAEAAQRMCEAVTIGQVAGAALDYAAALTPRCVLFEVRQSTAHVLSTRGLTIESADVARLGFPIISDGVFTLLRGNDSYRGEIPDEASYRDFFARLQTTAPRECLILPVYHDDRLIAIFYGDGGESGCVGGPTAMFSRLMKKLVLAIQVVSLKGEIHAA